MRTGGNLGFKLVSAIAAPLVIQIGLLSYLGYLLDGTERLSKAEVHSRDVTNKLDSLGHLLSLKALATLQFAVTKDPDYTRIVNDSAAEVPNELKQLRHLCAGDQGIQQDLNTLTDVATKLSVVCDRALGEDGQPSLERLQCPTVKENWQLFYETRNRLMAKEKKRHDQIMAALPEAKDQLKYFVYLGVALNVILAVIAISLLAGRIVKRLNLLTSNAIALAEGKAVVGEPAAGTDELALLDQTFHKMSAALKQALDQEAKLARVDSLSQLPNRFSFSERVLTSTNHQSSPKSSCIIICDIDKFKLINDRFGHAIGDEAIKLTANCIQQSIRDSDVAARWGGEEFIINLPNTDIAGATVLAERIRTTVMGAILTCGEITLSFTLSCGIAELQPEEEIEHLIQRADAALYRAKEEGRNRVMVASADERLPSASGVMQAVSI